MHVSEKEKIMFSWLAWREANGMLLRYVFVCFLVFTNHSICVGESLQVIIAEADTGTLKNKYLLFKASLYYI